MMNRIALLLALSVLTTASSSSQTDCDGERYRYISAFDNVSVSEGHVYGGNIDALGIDTELDFDFYEAVGNTASDRPLLLIAHGGFFLGGSNDGLDVVPLCEDFARMGYAVASFSYRLGIANVLDLENELVKAVWRGVHDGRAAVRYFRQSVEEDGNPWGIDPDRIYMGGVSAGGFLARPPCRRDAEIPANIDQARPAWAVKANPEIRVIAPPWPACSTSQAAQGCRLDKPGMKPAPSTEPTMAPSPMAPAARLHGLSVTDVGSATLHVKLKPWG